jgi:nucleoside 2-deoxyribosyltransferase
MSQVFISYSSADRKFVQKLASDLATRLPQIQVFYDMLIPTGTSYADVLAAQIEQADVVLAVLSPDYLESAWAHQELNVAVERQLKKQARLIPLLVRPCKPSVFLSQLVWVDFTEDYETALASLIWGITGEQPQAADGKQPGVPINEIDPNELESLRREVQAAVELFKSRPSEAAPVQQAATLAGPGPEGKRHCFVVMPFGDQDLQVVYEDFVRPTLVDGCNLLCERGDDVFGSNVIMDDILKSVEDADVILADLTGKNANVFYEVGICHALGKPVLLLAQSMDDVPFDLRHRRVLLYEYSPRGCKRLEGTLKENMNAVLGEL